MFDDLVTLRDPPPNRVGRCEGGIEHVLSEGAVMLAFAMHLLTTVPDLTHVAIHPDGEHGKRFDFRDWFIRHGTSIRSRWAPRHTVGSTRPLTDGRSWSIRHPDEATSRPISQGGAMSRRPRAGC